MAQFIATNVLMVALGAMLYLIARSLPRIGEDPALRKEGIIDRWANSQVPEKIDAVVNGVLEKALRKAKIVLMKVDNSITAHLKKVKPMSPPGNGKTQIDFKEMAAQKNGNGSSGSEVAKIEEPGNN